MLQREIDAFLASFRNPTTYFYQSNLGVGEVANVMLWAGFLFFCLVSIIREILVSRLSFIFVGFRVQGSGFRALQQPLEVTKRLVRCYVRCLLCALCAFFSLFFFSQEINLEPLDER